MRRRIETRGSAADGAFGPVRPASGARRRRSRVAAIVALLCVGLLTGCPESEGGDGSDGGDTGGDGGPDPALANCERVVDKFRGCGLISSGPIDCETFGAESETDPDFPDYDDCIADCLVAPSCGELETFVCGLDASLYLGCLDTCTTLSCDDGVGTYKFWEICDDVAQCGDASDEAGCTFVCDNGSEVDADERCDGLFDCGDGSDEAGCAKFMCDDGIFEVNDAQRCDGFGDCFDASDEVGCPDSFICDNVGGFPQAIPQRQVCDGGDDCDDGSDEVGCTFFRCDNGLEIDPGLQCDWDDDCGDGSDERGCASAVCPVI